MISKTSNNFKLLRFAPPIKLKIYSNWPKSSRCATRNQREIIFFPPCSRAGLEIRIQLHPAGRGERKIIQCVLVDTDNYIPTTATTPNPTLQHFHKDTASSLLQDPGHSGHPNLPRQNILISGRKSIWDLELMIILDLKYRLIIKIASLRDFISAIQVRTNQFRSFQLVRLLLTLCFKFLLVPQV